VANFEWVAAIQSPFRGKRFTAVNIVGAAFTTQRRAGNALGRHDRGEPDWSGTRIMKIKELAAIIEGLNPNLELLCLCADEGSKQRTHPFKIFSVEGMSASVIRTVRRADEVPQVAFGHESGMPTKPVAIVHITTDF
jgi:hypothetical protein